MSSAWRRRALPLPLIDLLRNLWAACHLLAFRRSALRWLVPTPGNFLVLLFLSLAVSVLFDFISEGWPGEWSPSGVAVYALPSFVLLVFGQILAARHGLWRLGLAPASAWLAADILLGLAQCGMQYADQQDHLPAGFADHVGLLYTMLYAWPILAVVFVFTRALAWPWWERSLAFIVLLGVFTAWSLAFSDERLWSSTQEEGPAATSLPLLNEQVFYAQPELLRRALDGLVAERPERSDWYFLGVGGSASQDVFRHETETVHTLFDTRFATSGRSLVLINNGDTALAQPIATRTSISRAVHAIAARMNPDQDVLFLFLSSHGSEDHEIELSYWPLELAAITPEWLRRTLDETGIRRRVIVLSACYSGGFIPVLQTPDTLIITASDASHASFGCSDDADLTYFGRAFFDEALRRQPSLRAAFDASVITIRQREKANGFEASHPQWVIGERLQAELPGLEKTLFPPIP
ncbi:MAG: C13 family peptidase [bacterium]|nr:C13 family peptidase [bacterium]